jgi:hypothetical protein
MRRVAHCEQVEAESPVALRIPRLLSTICVLLAACSGGGGGPPTPTSPVTPQAATYTAKSGVAQKGPLIKGATVTAQELDAMLSPTGSQFSYQITSNLGTFSPTSTFNSQYIGLLATGYYFDEIANTVSSGTVTLNGYSDLAVESVLNVNLLTTLEYQRIQTLVTKSNMSFMAARTQAENEVLAALNIPTGNYGSFDTLDLSGTSDGDHILEAISCLFVYGNSAGSLSQLIANFQSDIGANGVIKNPVTAAALVTAAKAVNPAAVAVNLTQYYASPGLTFTAANISEWIAQSGDGVIGKFAFQVPDATPSTVFTFPASVVSQFAGTSVSMTAGQLSVNGTPASGAVSFNAGDTVTLSPGIGNFPSGVLTAYLVSGSKNLVKVSFVSGLVSIAVTPNTPSVPVGLAQQFKATGTFSDTSTANLTSTVTWTSGTAANATVNASSGLANALAVGSSVITATSGSVSGGTTLNVTPAAVQSIAITPNPATVGVGVTQQLTAMGSFSDGSQHNVTTAAIWSSDTTGVATVGPTTGLLTGAAIGSANISATIGSVNATVPLTVSATLISIAVTPNAPNVPVGLPQQFTATGTLADSSSVTSTVDLTSSVAWSSGTPANATVNLTSGLANALVVGSTVITGTLGSVSGSATLTVTPAVVESIAITPNPATVGVGATLQLTATGSFSDGSIQNVTTVAGWTSDTPAVATVGPTTGLATGVAIGSANISAAIGSVTGTVPVSVATTWTAAASLPLALVCHTATLLQNGTVLVAGGHLANGTAVAAAEVYDPVANTWTAVASMPSAQSCHTATLLNNGQVLVAGGYDASDNYTAAASLYDPVANAWSTAPNMLAARVGHTATLLPSGQVLVAGGINAGGSVQSGEIYDPVANSWSSAGAMLQARSGHTATLLASGVVLMAGGSNGGTFTATTEFYNPSSNSWTAGPSMSVPRVAHTATLLQSGIVLVAGSTGYGSVQPAASAETYDPVANAWTVVGSMAIGRGYQTATLLPNGQVLVAGGQSPNYLSEAELFNPSTAAWTTTASMASAHVGATATLLPNGTPLVTGGQDQTGNPTAVCELYW